MFKISQNLQVSDLFSLALSSKKKADGGQCVGVNVELPDALIMPPLQSPSRSSMSAFALKLQGWRTLDRRVLFLGTKTVAEGSDRVLFPQAELQSSGEVNCLHNTQRVLFRMQLRGIGRCGGSDLTPSTRVAPLPVQLWMCGDHKFDMKDSAVLDILKSAKTGTKMNVGGHHAHPHSHSYSCIVKEGQGGSKVRKYITATRFKGAENDVTVVAGSQTKLFRLTAKSAALPGSYVVCIAEGGLVYGELLEIGCTDGDLINDDYAKQEHPAKSGRLKIRPHPINQHPKGSVFECNVNDFRCQIDGNSSQPLQKDWIVTTGWDLVNHVWLGRDGLRKKCDDPGWDYSRDSSLFRQLFRGEPTLILVAANAHMQRYGEKPDNRKEQFTSKTKKAREQLQKVRRDANGLTIERKSAKVTPDQVPSDVQTKCKDFLLAAFKDKADRIPPFLIAGKYSLKLFTGDSLPWFNPDILIQDPSAASPASVHEFNRGQQNVKFIVVHTVEYADSSTEPSRMVHAEEPAKDSKKSGYDRLRAPKYQPHFFLYDPKEKNKPLTMGEGKFVVTAPGKTHKLTYAIRHKSAGGALTRTDQWTTSEMRLELTILHAAGVGTAKIQGLNDDAVIHELGVPEPRVIDIECFDSKGFPVAFPATASANDFEVELEVVQPKTLKVEHQLRVVNGSLQLTNFMLCPQPGRHVEFGVHGYVKLQLQGSVKIKEDTQKDRNLPERFDVAVEKSLYLISGPPCKATITTAADDYVNGSEISCQLRVRDKHDNVPKIPHFDRDTGVDTPNWTARLLLEWQQEDGRWSDVPGAATNLSIDHTKDQMDALTESGWTIADLKTRKLAVKCRLRVEVVDPQKRTVVLTAISERPFEVKANSSYVADAGMSFHVDGSETNRAAVASQSNAGDRVTVLTVDPGAAIRLQFSKVLTADKQEIASFWVSTDKRSESSKQATSGAPLLIEWTAPTTVTPGRNKLEQDHVFYVHRDMDPDSRRAKCTVRLEVRSTKWPPDKLTLQTTDVPLMLRCGEDTKGHFTAVALDAHGNDVLWPTNALAAFNFPSLDGVELRMENSGDDSPTSPSHLVHARAGSHDVRVTLIGHPKVPCDSAKVKITPGCPFKLAAGGDYPALHPKSTTMRFPKFNLYDAAGNECTPCDVVYTCDSLFRPPQRGRSDAVCDIQSMCHKDLQEDLKVDVEHTIKVGFEENTQRALEGDSFKIVVKPFPYAMEIKACLAEGTVCAGQCVFSGGKKVIITLTLSSHSMPSSIEIKKHNKRPGVYRIPQLKSLLELTTKDEKGGELPLIAAKPLLLKHETGAPWQFEFTPEAEGKCRTKAGTFDKYLTAKLKADGTKSATAAGVADLTEAHAPLSVCIDSDSTSLQLVGSLNTVSADRPNTPLGEGLKLVIVDRFQNQTGDGSEVRLTLLSTSTIFLFGKTTFEVGRAFDVYVSPTADGPAIESTVTLRIEAAAAVQVAALEVEVEITDDAAIRDVDVRLKKHRTDQEAATAGKCRVLADMAKPLEACCRDMIVTVEDLDALGAWKADLEQHLKTCTKKVEHRDALKKEYTSTMALLPDQHGAGQPLWKGTLVLTLSPEQPAATVLAQALLASNRGLQVRQCVPSALETSGNSVMIPNLARARQSVEAIAAGAAVAENIDGFIGFAAELIVAAEVTEDEVNFVTFSRKDDRESFLDGGANDLAQHPVQAAVLTTVRDQAVFRDVAGVRQYVAEVAELANVSGSALCVPDASTSASTCSAFGPDAVWTPSLMDPPSHPRSIEPSITAERLAELNSECATGWTTQQEEPDQIEACKSAIDEIDANRDYFKDALDKINEYNYAIEVAEDEREKLSAKRVSPLGNTDKETGHSSKKLRLEAAAAAASSSSSRSVAGAPSANQRGKRKLLSDEGPSKPAKKGKNPAASRPSDAGPPAGTQDEPICLDSESDDADSEGEWHATCTTASKPGAGRRCEGKHD